MVQQLTLPPLVRGVWYPMTWEEFLEWSPDEGQSEWVNGKGIAYVSNVPRHIRMAFFLAQVLSLYTRVFDLGEVFFDRLLVRLPARPSGRMPDIVVIGREDVPLGHARWFEGRALLVAEFLSEESVDRDLREKRVEFEEAGYAEYLVADARLDQDEFVFLRLDEEGRYQEIEPDDQGRYHSESLPGFWLDPSWFKQDPLPSVEWVMMQIAPEAYWKYLTRLRDEAPR